MSKNYELLLHVGRPSPLMDNQARMTTSDTHPVLRVHPPPGDEPGTRNTSDDLDFEVRAFLQAILRRRVWIYVSTATMLAAAGLVCLFMTPQYKAESKLEILKQDTGGLSVGPGISSGGSSDPLDFNVTLQTQLGVLKSDTLAWQVMRELQLVNAGNVSPKPLPSPSTADPQQLAAAGDTAPDKPAAQALKRFKSKLKVDAISGTRLITVSYMHPDPKMAARIVNQLVSDFVEYNFQVRYNATAKATDWLGRQLVDLKSQVEKSQERAVQLQKESGIFGEDEHHNIVLTRLEQLNNQLTNLEADRVIKESVYKLSRSGNPELIAGMLGTQPERATPEAANPEALLNNLRQQEAALRAEYADAAAKYGPAYPRLIQIKDKLGSVRSSITAELGKVAERAKREYELAASREAAARKAFEEQKAIAARMNDKATDFLIAKHEADSSRVLYEHLLEKLKEADVLAGLRSSELHVLDPAVIPSRPARPNVPLYLGLGALAGLFFGLVIVFVVETMDRTIRDVGAIETTTYVPVLGVIPHAALTARTGLKRWLNAPTREARNGAAQEALLLSLRNAAVAEAFRSVRTNLLLPRLDEPTRVLMVTSGMPQEGKSFVSLNLAASFAYNGGKVLLVDADLRRGTLSLAINRRSRIGLSQVLLEDLDPSAAYTQIDDVPGLTFMASGHCPHHASELLGSEQMDALIESWRKQFDYVLIDTPPAMPVTDAVVLSRKVDAVIVVARFAVTNQPCIHRTLRLLRDVQVAPLGVVLNAMDVRSPEYYQYSGFYGRDDHLTGHSGDSRLLGSPPPRQ
jgi:succinoglycan biosynthesis transport protein ExoP